MGFYVMNGSWLLSSDRKIGNFGFTDGPGRNTNWFGWILSKKSNLLWFCSNLFFKFKIQNLILKISAEIRQKFSNFRPYRPCPTLKKIPIWKTLLPSTVKRLFFCWKASTRHNPSPNVKTISKRGQSLVESTLSVCLMDRVPSYQPGLPCTRYQALGRT